MEARDTCKVRHIHELEPVDTAARMRAALFRPHADAILYLSDDVWAVVEGIRAAWVTIELHNGAMKLQLRSEESVVVG